MTGQIWPVGLRFDTHGFGKNPKHVSVIIPGVEHSHSCSPEILTSLFFFVFTGRVFRRDLLAATNYCSDPWRDLGSCTIERISGNSHVSNAAPVTPAPHP